MTYVKYQELGTVGEQKRMYAEGEEFQHPSGAVYKRIEGNWTCIKKPGEQK